jgi:hypothetical protein
MLILAILTVVFSDSGKTQPLFIPADAFRNPRAYELSRGAVEDYLRDMNQIAEARAMLEDKQPCATVEPQPAGEVDGSGTIVEVTSGWNADRRYVTSLARVKLKSGDEVLMEFLFGTMTLGRVTWCSGTERLKEGDTITFSAVKSATTPAHLICVSLPDHHGRNE